MLFHTILKIFKKYKTNTFKSLIDNLIEEK